MGGFGFASPGKQDSDSAGKNIQFKSKILHFCVVQSTEPIQTPSVSTSTLRMHKRFTLFCRVCARPGIAQGTETCPHSQDTQRAPRDSSNTLHMGQQPPTLWDPQPLNDNSNLQSNAIKSSPACKPLAESTDKNSSMKGVPDSPVPAS